MKSYMCSELASTMFDILKKRINSTVILKVWEFGVAREVTGILKDVTDFGTVTLDCGNFPMVGEGRAIEMIEAIGELDNTRHLVYINPYVTGYNIKNKMEAAQTEQQIFGYSPVLDSATKNPVERDVHLGRRR